MEKKVKIHRKISPKRKLEKATESVKMEMLRIRGKMNLFIRMGI